MDLRKAVAAKIADLEAAPLRLLLNLANDDIDVADLILRQSPLLADLDLIYIIKSKNARYWRSIARRESLNEKVMDVLVDTGDVETAVNLLENTKVKLSLYTMNALSDMAQKERRIATPLAYRQELPGDIAARILNFVGKDLKAQLMERFDIQPDEAQTVICEIDHVIDEMTEILSDNDPNPSYMMLDEAHKAKRRGRLRLEYMMESLRRGQLQTFVAQFAVFVDIDPDTLISVLMQEAGHGLAVLCRAAGITKPDFMSIFLLTRRIRNQGVMVETHEITQAVNYYNKITEEMAKEILSGPRNPATL